MTNYELIAIKLGEMLKYGSSVNEINRIGKAVLRFNKKEYQNDSITSKRAKEVYDWVMTLSEQDLSKSDKSDLLSKFIKELAPEFALSKVSEGFEIVNITSKQKIVKNSDSKEVFVLIPFKEIFQTFYYNVIKPVVESLGYSISKADEDLRVGEVIKQILESIQNSRLVIADVSGKNPNVFYELGFAHGIHKKVLIITQSSEDIPFDISHIRYFTYLYNQDFTLSKEQFYQTLKKNLEVMEDE